MSGYALHPEVPRRPLPLFSEHVRLVSPTELHVIATPGRVERSCQMTWHNQNADMPALLFHLHEQTISSVIFDDETYEWVFAFTGGRTLRLSSHWRLASANQIVVGSEDEGQRFGLDTEVDVKQRIAATVGSKEVTAASVDEHADLEVRFGTDVKLQVFNGSSGHEGWQLLGPGKRYVVGQGGGSVVDSGDER